MTFQDVAAADDDDDVDDDNDDEVTNDVTFLLNKMKLCC